VCTCHCSSSLYRPWDVASNRVFFTIRELLTILKSVLDADSKELANIRKICTESGLHILAGMSAYASCKHLVNSFEFLRA